MAELEEQISRLNCKFIDSKLENKYKEMKWEKNSRQVFSF
jgi:hypothetical protein